MMRYPSAIALAPAQGEWTVRPEDVCGGVWVEEVEKFVPVEPGRVIPIGDNGATLVEYADEQGNVRANLLSVPRGQASPTWLLTETAADADYEERHVAVAGAGTLVSLASIGLGRAVACRHPLPEHRYPLGVYPFGAFRIEASSALAVHVLATFSAAPFRDEYERRVTFEETLLQP